LSFIEVAHVSYTFPDGTEALKDISFSLEKGTLTVVSGRNGSGKSVLMRMLNGLYRPGKGSIHISGISIAKHPAKGRKFIGLVFQDADSQIVGQTVERDIAFGLENLRQNKEDIQRKINELLPLLGLQNHRGQRPHTLSGGEKRLLTIAGILAMEPAAIALDEPFTNLDYPGVLQVLRTILDLKASGHTIIIVTHDLEKLLAHADKLILLDAGAAVAQGQPETILTPELAARCGIRISPVYFGEPHTEKKDAGAGAGEVAGSSSSSNDSGSSGKTAGTGESSIRIQEMSWLKG